MLRRRITAVNRSYWCVSRRGLSNRPLFEAIASQDPSRTAIIHSKSQNRFSYGQLLADVATTRDQLAGLKGQRVGLLSKNNYDYVGMYPESRTKPSDDLVTLLGIIAANCTAIPLAPVYPPKELAYIVENSGAKVLLSSEEYQGKAEESLNGNARLHVFKKHELRRHGKAVIETPTDGGLMLYTSGTTSLPVRESPRCRLS
jgi:malonyl-CoA/methylmalonyl-CoA synthetase